MAVTVAPAAAPAPAPAPAPHRTGIAPIPAAFDPDFSPTSPTPALARVTGDFRIATGKVHTGPPVETGSVDFNMKVSERPKQPMASFEDAARGAVELARAKANTVMAVYTAGDRFEAAPVGLRTWRLEGDPSVISARFQITPNNPAFKLQGLFTGQNWVDFRDGAAKVITHEGPAKEPTQPA